MTNHILNITDLIEPERVWALCDVVVQLGDVETELSDGCIEAVEAMKDLEEIEKLRLIHGIGSIKFDSQNSPTEPKTITSYVDSDIAIECTDTWGDYLEELGFNDASWIIYSLSYDVRDYSRCKDRRKVLDELAESIENGQLNKDELKNLAYQLAFSIGEKLYYFKA